MATGTSKATSTFSIAGQEKNKSDLADIENTHQRDISDLVITNRLVGQHHTKLRAWVREFMLTAKDLEAEERNIKGLSKVVGRVV